MSFPRRMSLMRRVCLFSGVALVAAVSVSAQSSISSSQTTQFAPGESSSSAFQLPGEDGLYSAAALRTAATSLVSDGGGAAAGQDYGTHHSLFKGLAFEASGGANGPIGNASSNYISWGGNFTVGGGLHFSKRFSLLAEYQLLDDKLPGPIIAETGATGGNAHIWSLTLDPVIDLFPKSTNSVYITGGGGFYRKVTNFTDPEEQEYCDYYYCGIATENVVIGHFSSNQGGWNAGGGFTHRVGGLSGDGRMKLFAEVRFLDVDTPAVSSSPNGLGTATVGAGTKLLPISLGVRW